MESSGYEKSMHLAIGSVVGLALFVLGLLNMFFSVSSDFARRGEQMTMTKQVVEAANQADAQYQQAYDRLDLEAAWLSERWDQLDFTGDNLRMTDEMRFIEEKGISVRNVDATQPVNTGNVIFNGDVKTASEIQKRLMNGMPDFFAHCAMIQNATDFEFTTMFYGKDAFIAYFPHTMISGKNTDYSAMFETMNVLLDEEGKAEASESDELPTWHYVSTPRFSAFTPIYVEGQLKGILSISFSQDSMMDFQIGPAAGAEVYVIDEKNRILFTNTGENYYFMNAIELFDRRYGGLNYYQNKFPTALEIRETQGYTQYISKMSRDGWYTVVVTQSDAEMSSLQWFINVIYIISWIVVVIAVLRNYSKRRAHLREVFRTAATDSMTGLLNHKNIIEYLDRMLKFRRIKSIGLMMADIDNFKSINDTYGHSIGDDVIKLCADIFKELLQRTDDVAGRYGGEEFLLLLGHGTAQETNELAEKIRITFQERMHQKMDLDATLSIGVVYLRKPTKKDSHLLIDLADQNLYKAKDSGKNKVISLVL